MALNRITGLGIVVLGSSMLLAAACDSGGTTASPNNGGGTSVGDVGGASGNGGTSAISGNTGGAISGTTGGAKATGGAPSTSTDTSTVTATKADNCGTATAATGSFTINNKNYFKVGDYAGYGFVYISPTTDPAMSVTCDNSTFGTSTNALCGAGTVPADPSYNAVGGIGFNLNQASSGGTDSAKAITSPATVSTVTVTFANTAASGLHIQIVQNAAGTDSGGVNYCYDAKGKESPLVLNASDFTTKCWGDENGSFGDPWDGTGAQSFQFVIPSDATAATPFDACIENVVFG